MSTPPYSNNSKKHKPGKKRKNKNNSKENQNKTDSPNQSPSPPDSQVYKGPANWQHEGYEVLTPPANYNKDKKQQCPTKFSSTPRKKDLPTLTHRNPEVNERSPTHVTCNLTSPPQECSVNYGNERGTVTKRLDENEGFTHPYQRFKCKAKNDGISPERVDATQEGEQVLNPVSSETSLNSSSSDENDHIPESGGNYGDKKEDFPTDVSEISADKDDSITELNADETQQSLQESEVLEPALFSQKAVNCHLFDSDYYNPNF